MAPQLFVILWLVSLLQASGSVDPQEAGFDLFILVRSYSPGYCRSTRCSIHPVGAFTLHGLWPEYEDGGYPQYCKTKAPLVENTTLPDQHAMDCEWASFKGPNSGFWDHEWDRHGTCAVPVLGSRPNFFATVLDLNLQYNLDVPLAAAGVTPSDSRSYPVAAIQAAIDASYGAPPVLHCYRDMVVELWMCLTLDLSPTPCPAHVQRGGSCRGGEVRLLEGDTVPPSCSKYFPSSSSSSRQDMLSLRGADAARSASGWR